MPEHAGVRAVKKASARRVQALENGVATDLAVPVLGTNASQTVTVASIEFNFSTSDVDFIIARLTASEPQLCSEFALKAMMPGNKRQYVKVDLLRLLEFVTGRDAYTDISDEVQNLDSFDSDLHEDAARRGHRLTFIKLPPKFDNELGVYSWIPSKSVLRHNFTLEEIELASSTIEEMKYPLKAIIYSNWSETTACLKTPGTSFRLVLGSLFDCQFPKNCSPTKAAPSFKRQRTSDVAGGSCSVLTRSSDAGVVPPPPPPPSKH